MRLDRTLNNVPGHHWVRIIITNSSPAQPSHKWLYEGLLRRDAWRIGRVVVIVMRLRRRHHR